MARGSLLNRMKMRKQDTQSTQNTAINNSLTKDLDDNLKTIKQLFGDPDDLVVRELLIGGLEKRAAIVYISGLSDENEINSNILKPILLNRKEIETNILDKIHNDVIAVTDAEKVNQLDDVSLSVLSGNTAFFLEGEDEVLLMGTAGGESRAIQEPEAERLIRGPRDGFVESIITNMALLRRDIKDSNLQFKEHIVGRKSKQKVIVCYIKGITEPNLVKEINRRIASIDLEYISDSSSVEQWIEDSLFSPFPQILDTERPDKVSSNLIQGKVGILVDGTPFALIAPISLGDGLQSPEDYTQRWISASLLRVLRYFSAFIAIFLPGLFVALVSYHPGMIPSTLAFSIAATREGVPFPAVIEAVIMAVTFEILHEAGIRLPKAIGQTIGIVGGLVIGEAAVSAGIVSPIMVIVTALTAIASFSIPSFSMSITFRTLRFLVLFAGGTLGLYGIILAYIMINIHIVNLKSFGVPYSTPFAPLLPRDLINTVIRTPMTKLAVHIGQVNKLSVGKKNKNKKSKNE